MVPSGAHPQESGCDQFFDDFWCHAVLIGPVDQFISGNLAR